MQNENDTTRRPMSNGSKYGPPADEAIPTKESERVTKRNGELQDISIAKIERRIKTLSKGLEVQCLNLAQDVIMGVYDGIHTSEIDRLAAGFAHEKITDHPDYDVLAARIMVSNHQKETMAPFSEVMRALHKAGQIKDEFMKVVDENADRLDNVIDYDRDYLFTYFGFRTFETSYGLRIKQKDPVTGVDKPVVYERPQHMWMRVGLALHLDDIDAAIETYDWMSCQYFTHATPTLFNSGKRQQQLASCFLLAMEEDSIEGIYSTLSNVAKISKNSGGIGIHISNIRAEGSPIVSAGCESAGIIPMLKPYEATANYVDQGRKRKGAIACYLEVHHADIEDFLQIKSQTGDESRRMRDLHLALWMCDLFMRRVEADEEWSLMCPFYSPDLQDLYGEAFERRYQEYEAMGAPYVRKTVRARDLWTRIVDSQITTGEPYMVYKDSVNKKTNHQNLGTIRSSNLCSEVVQYSDANHTATCNLASIALKRFVIKRDDGTRSYDFDTLKYVVKMVTRNLDRVIDINDYPTIEGKRSNIRERPMGIGVQGLADAYIAMRYPYDSEEAAQLNREIFETIYFGAMEASCELAKEYGPYPSYHMNGGCPVSHGKFQFDMWADDGYDVKLSGRWDWDALKAEVKEHGVRNSLLVALMPTASTSQLLGNFESFEAATNNIYVRSTLAGSFKVINQQMVLDLIDAGLWTNEMKAKVIYLGGSIQGIEEIPKEIRDLYKTSFDLSQKVIIDQSADRSCFVDQSQSLNIHMAEPTMASVSSMHMYGNKKGLKTGMYYLRSRPAKRAAQVTVDPSMERQFERQLSTPAAAPPDEEEPQVPDGWVCNKEEGCTMCSG